MDSSPVVRDPRKRRREKSLEEESVKIKEEEPQTPNVGSLSLNLKVMWTCSARSPFAT